MKILTFNYENPLIKKLYDLYIASNYYIKFIDIHDKLNIIEDIIIKNKITHILYTDEIYDIEECQKNIDTIKTNNFNAKKIYELANKFNLSLIYLSSYEVYGDSQNSSYCENSIINPINNLGISQANSESLFKKHKKTLILRTSWIFGSDSCYVKQILSNVNTTFLFSNTKIINPTPVTFLFESINSLCDANIFETFNCASIDYCSKKEVVEFLLEVAGVEKEVLPIPDYIKNKLTKSANFSGLDSLLLSKTIKIKNKNWKSFLLEYLQTEFI